jgi:hypothetical protein
MCIVMREVGAGELLLLLLFWLLSAIAVGVLMPLPLLIFMCV